MTDVHAGVRTAGAAMPADHFLTHLQKWAAAALGCSMLRCTQGTPCRAWLWITAPRTLHPSTLAAGLFTISAEDAAWQHQVLVGTQQPTPFNLKQHCLAACPWAAATAAPAAAGSAVQPCKKSSAGAVGAGMWRSIPAGGAHDTLRERLLAVSVAETFIALHCKLSGTSLATCMEGQKLMMPAPLMVDRCRHQPRSHQQSCLIT